MTSYDFRGLKCPIPVLKAFKIMKKEKKNNLFIFLTDDVSAPNDFRDFCKNTGNKITQLKKIDTYYEIIIEKIISEI